LQQGRINSLFLLQQGYFLLVPVIAQVEGQRLLLDAQHFAEAFYVASFMYPVGSIII